MRALGKQVSRLAHTGTSVVVTGRPLFLTLFPRGLSGWIHLAVEELSIFPVRRDPGALPQLAVHRAGVLDQLREERQEIGL
jgi:hypothetical protein